jgi:hypothetical protein
LGIGSPGYCFGVEQAFLRKQGLDVRDKNLSENRRFAIDHKIFGLAYLYLGLHDMVNREAQKGYYKATLRLSRISWTKQNSLYP